MPEIWTKYRLGDVVDLRKETIDPSDFHEEKYIGLEHIGQGDFLLNGIGIGSDATSNKFRFYENDVLYGKIRPYFKKVYKPKFPGICSTDILVIKSKNDNIVLQDYLYQYIRTQFFTDKATESSTGTKMPRADWGVLKKLEIQLPDLEEQQRIASILSALDDKIELNLEMNKTLEEMAMAIYKEWFVDFGPFRDGEFVDSELGMIPKGWEVKSISNISSFNNGVSYRSKFLAEEGIPMINLKCFSRNGGFRYDGVKYYIGEYKERDVVLEGDLLVAMTDLTQDRVILGSSILVPPLINRPFSIISTDVGVVRLNEAFIHVKNMLYYLMRTNAYHQYILGFGNGSTVIHLDKSGILNCNILIPPQSILEEFNDIINPIIDLGNRNNTEIFTLEETRDYLLPKLISGEIRVKDAEKEVQEVL